jgi:N-methylhydantoinase B
VRRIPLSSFLVANRKTALAPDEIAIALHIRTQSGRGHFLKLGARRYLVISIAMVAGVVELDATSRVTSARIAIGSCSAVARRQPRLEAAITGRMLQTVPSSEIADGLLDGIQPITDVRASAQYRRAAALELARDLLANFATDRRSAA